jgi:hypothetical protein
MHVKKVLVLKSKKAVPLVRYLIKFIRSRGAEAGAGAELNNFGAATLQCMHVTV